ncbi:C-type lectin 37Db isoform X3 [Drosophila sulfurigaster albostrigata]|uniref:C-type lectin 37Db isoform X3 n=1 Tax=Drosophila sulfurigaster albostrigata TaxID=89887 RepID=UPI002D219DB9|nr:C-type lectin 37Db isoform X3 [Drosophila sulfurigaster albostrigata]
MDIINNLLSIFVAYGILDRWQRIGSKYYYIERLEEVAWYEALSKCQAIGGHLLSIKNQEEFDAIKCELDREKHYWIDINDLTKEGEFISGATGQKATYFNWHQTEPNNKNGNENCVELYYHNDKHLMNDDNCQEKELFICEPNDQV